jgi:hypothetical protein
MLASKDLSIIASPSIVKRAAGVCCSVCRLV